MSLKSKDCLEYLEKELKKELIGPMILKMT